MAVNDIHQVRFVFYNGHQNCINTVHYRVKALITTEPTDAEKALTVNNFLQAAFKAIASSGWTFKGTKYRRLDPTPTAEQIDVTNAGACSLAGDELPPQLTALLSLRAVTAPPKTRSRMYLPSAVEASNSSGGFLEAAYVTAVNTLGALLIVDFNSAGAGGASATLRCVVRHRKPPVDSWQLSSFVTRPAWATQRRRSQINRDDVSAI